MWTNDCVARALRNRNVLHMRHRRRRRGSRSDIGMSTEEERLSSLRDEKDFRLADHRRAPLLSMRVEPRQKDTVWIISKLVSSETF